MLGFLIAGIIALVNFLNHMALEVTFLRSTHFLFQWYIITTIIMGVLMLIFTLGIIGTGTAAGGVLGFLGTSAVSLIGWIIFTFRRALFLAGAYLLSTAMNYASGIPQWDTAKLVVGGLLLFIALITRGREEQNFKQQLMPFKPTNERRRESMNDLKKETNTKFKSSFLLVLIILAALAVLIWFVVLPKINPPAPPPVPQPPVIIEETIPPPPPPVEPVRAIGDIKPPKLVQASRSSLS